MSIKHAAIDFKRIAGISPFNVRQADENDDVSGLAATIRFAGVINPILVHQEENGAFWVLAGGRRWRALESIVAETPDFLALGLEVKLVEGATEAEMRSLSMAENIDQKPMHPVRQFEAFSAIAKALPTRDEAVDTIAREFGVTKQIVRQRLALGDLAPIIRAAWLAGKIGAEGAKVYAEAPVVAQEAFYEQHKDQWIVSNPFEIRRALLSNLVPADHPAALFVGDGAYLAAGGEIKAPLFAEFRQYSLAILEKCAREKCLREGEKIRVAEGWGFVVYFRDAEAAEFKNAPEPPKDYLDREKTRLAAIGEALENLESDPLNPTTAAKRGKLLDEFDGILAKATCRAIAAKDRIALGIRVGYEIDGRLDVLRGLAPIIEKTAAVSAVGERQADAGARSPSSASSPPPLPASEPIGNALRLVVEETATAALHETACRSVNLALAFAVAALGCASGSGTIIDLRLHPRRNWTPASALLAEIKPQMFARALALAVAAPLADLTAAFCELVGASIDASRMVRLDPALDLLRAAASFTAIETALQRNFDPKLYFAAASKAAKLDAIRETEGPASAADAESLGKADLSERAALTAADYDWLPPSLRDLIPLAREPEAEAPPRDARTTVQAMLDAIEGATPEFIGIDEAGTEPAPNDPDADDADEGGEFEDGTEATPNANPAVAALLIFVKTHCDEVERGRVGAADFHAAFKAANPGVADNHIAFSQACDAAGLEKKRANTGRVILGLRLRVNSDQNEAAE